MTATTGPGTITLLSRLAKAIHRRTPEELLGMRWRQFLVLSYLSERDSVPQHVLGDVCMVDANNLVLLLNELETLGYVERRRDPDDRRRHTVSLTSGGRAALLRAERAREAVEDDVLGGLDGGEREALRALLNKALEGLR
jgi:DNA-binding MarR family transcriptional regulator